MKTLLTLATVLASTVLAAPATSYPSVSTLVAKGRKATGLTARVPFSEAAGQTPNFVRALQLTPKAAQPMANLFQAIVYQGAIQPEVKLGMALRIAQIYDSGYLALHAERLLRASESGRKLLPLLDASSLSTASAESVAVMYVDKLTRDVHGVSDEDFRHVRAFFNDSQVVELTTTTCYFNYLVRFAAALRLPTESWALEPAGAAESGVQTPIARVSLISDEQMAAVDARVKQMQANPNGWNIGFANSMRSMLLSPAAANAWMNYGNATREYASVDRTLKLHISFAVSMANGCRYCTLHQVLGLRRQGVDPTKLMAMKKDDGQLTPRELTAVEFARKLTAKPSSVTDADYAKLKAEFGEQGALEVVQQTCNFAFMNRFTDGLRLPSEDEAIRVYQETYGQPYQTK
ncbi:MAG: carboxymuconolactone decarboxylase family protein [Bryobacteraceae bacterium]